eukprot:TRINITY_DN20550_c0_g1_i1.p1 TRINITY_DN20550_c0_g1~~TRINITY_DN20550_c0_g1_i1.p1  ORF type:complete len:207 (+),score=34.96 TRINITY_DN20550_c0_g1_i1:44-664(+)
MFLVPMSASSSEPLYETTFDMVSDIIGSTFFENGHMYELCVKNLCIDTRVVAPKRSGSAPPMLLRSEVESGTKGSITNPSVADTQKIPVSERTPTDTEIVNEKVVTTYMLRHVPCKVTSHAMRVELKKRGFEGTYDFMYFPTRRNTSGVGYGFVNFVNAEHAAKFKDVFEGYAFPGTNSRKRCCVVPAEVQGLEANVKQFKRYVQR